MAAWQYWLVNVVILVLFCLVFEIIVNNEAYLRTVY